MNEEKRARQLARMEALQQRARHRIDQQQRHVDQRFARMRERIIGSAAVPSDNQQRIVLAALDLVDETGINELSLRKLATKLDMKAPALYWYFKSKDVLIDYMAEAILQSEFKNMPTKQDEQPWQDWLVDIAKRLRRAMRSRRDGARIVAGAHLYPAITLIRLFEEIQSTLIAADVEPRSADLITTTAVHLTFGRVIEEQSSPDPKDLDSSELQFIRSEFPTVAASIKRTIQDNKDGYDEFEASLRLFIGRV